MNAFDLSKDDRVKLKPCPFCGTIEHLASIRIGSQVDGFTPIAVRCHHLDCDEVQGPTGNGYAEAVQLWNRRHDETPSEFERLCGEKSHG
ncbi:Lar family restriction alleviation protein [Sinorhizobium meliloti]|uniref:Lar family restriction alleviation protein n=1 Tax=Rhizobium meliloti TaxID=382 RepID=UPI0012964DC6|nr:Lar family restriction alleviation protein [Sinorhizobium meliloti]MQX90286.1 hypothetical protein [Sinorhizobium meliloti]